MLIILDVNGPIFRKKKRGAKIAGLIRVKTKKANIFNINKFEIK